jgi:hypothetical protein
MAPVQNGIQPYVKRLAPFALDRDLLRQLRGADAPG